MIRWPQSRTRVERFDRSGLAAAGLYRHRAIDKSQHRPASSLCRKPLPLGWPKAGVSSSSPFFWKSSLIEPNRSRIFQVGIGCGQIFEICCADIAETDPILLQSTKMERCTRGTRDGPIAPYQLQVFAGDIPNGCIHRTVDMSMEARLYPRAVMGMSRSMLK